jgi:hypothetical protein
LSKSTFKDAIKKMEASLAEKLVGFSSKKIREMTAELKEELQTEYDTFFLLIVEDVVGALNTPSRFIPYYWQPLSDRWQIAKLKEGNADISQRHYIGLSNSSTARRPLGRAKHNGMSRLRTATGSKSKFVKVGPFGDYMRSLTSQGTTARFFGPVTLSYDFVSPDPRFSVTVSEKDGALQRVQVRSAERGTFVAFPKELKMTATVTAFGNLKGVAFNEKSVVDYIIKRVDPSNEKQWVKINSEYGMGRSKRPIRAVITPLLRYFIERRFPDIVRRAIKSRSQ